jgi:geranylgeranyl diphosphate synthase, type II
MRSASNGSALVASVLEEYGELTRGMFKHYLPDREPRRHLYDLVADYPTRGGKMMRPSICLASARAFGGRVEDALRTAVSLELLHNALLIHDDIEDESDERRGRPTLHRLHGVPMAVNVGDTLTLLSLKPLLDNLDHLGPHVARRILEDTERVAMESAEGQAMELGWRLDNVFEVDDHDYLEMVLKKTCWLGTIYPLRVGALIGTRSEVPPDQFVPFGFLLGAAFQIQDDVLNLCADARYGKERDGDLWEGKRTLPLIHLLRQCTPDERERIIATLSLSRETKAPTDVAWMRARMDHYGCIDYARQIAHGIAGAALEEFEVAFRGVPDSRDKRFIEGLATWVFERN